VKGLMGIVDNPSSKPLDHCHPVIIHVWCYLLLNISFVSLFLGHHLRSVQSSCIWTASVVLWLVVSPWVWFQVLIRSNQGL